MSPLVEYVFGEGKQLVALHFSHDSNELRLAVGAFRQSRVPRVEPETGHRKFAHFGHALPRVVAGTAGIAWR